MGFNNIARQSVRPGQLREFVFDELAEVFGERPRFMVEHYSYMNATVIGESILTAGKDDDAATEGREPAKDDTEAYQRWVETWERRRKMMAKHCVRDLGGFYHDGEDGEPDASKPASLADVPDILEALPLSSIAKLFAFCVDIENWKTERPKVKEVAGK